MCRTTESGPGSFLVFFRDVDVYTRGAQFLRTQKWANGHKCKGEGSREASGAGSEPNQPAHMEDRGAEETLSDDHTLGASASSASAR